MSRRFCGWGGGIFPSPLPWTRYNHTFMSSVMWKSIIITNKSLDEWNYLHVSASRNCAGFIMKKYELIYIHMFPLCFVCQCLYIWIPLFLCATKVAVFSHIEECDTWPLIPNKLTNPNPFEMFPDIPGTLDMFLPSINLPADFFFYNYI